MLVFSLAFVSASISAAEKVQLRLMANHLPPYLLISDDPKGPRYKGFEVEFTNALSQLSGIDFVFVECTWRGCIDALKEGKIDIAHSLILHKERTEYMDFLKPGYLYQDYATLFYQASTDERVVTSLEDIVEQKLSVGYLGSTFYFPEFENSDELIKVEVSDLEVGIKQLTSGRIDLLAGYNELFMGLGKQDKAEFRNLKIIDYRANVREPLHTAMSKNSKFLHVKTKLQLAIEQLIADGTMEKLKAKWFVPLELKTN